MDKPYDAASRRAPRASLVSVLDERLALPDAQRRQVLRLAAQGAAIPAAYALLGGDLYAASTAQPGAVEAPPLEATRAAAASARIVRNFDEPCIELLRLLHQAAEIEHALMIQYLYAAFSVKPAYQAIAGFGASGANDLLGVAIQEMQHLGKVNQLLVALGVAPTLIREDFPYEPDIYPFRFNLEPLSRASLAKYVWTEAPAGATDLNKAGTDGDRAFCLELERVLGNSPRPNYVGTLYDAVIARTEELIAAKDADLPDLRPWLPVLHDIKIEGEVVHFLLFKRLFLGTHKGFAGRADVWRSASDPEYPSHALPTNPTAYVGHANQIADPQALGLAWLGNLHYWILLMLLSDCYSSGSPERIALARGHI